MAEVVGTVLRPVWVNPHNPKRLGFLVRLCFALRSLALWRV
jgi:hypothetical protein